MKNDAMKNAPAGKNERPLMLAPAFKDYIWGGERLKRDWGKQTDLSPLAESWELSCHEAGPSVVASGEWAGRTLAHVLAAHPQFVGTKAEKAGEFPLLIKLIDAAGPLSVQVHPDDDYAERVEHALNWVPVKKGECFFIPAGTVHAIGAGLLIAEVQQSSNLTYRVYDYGRLGADGKPRPLHIDKALAVTRREPPQTPVGPTEPEQSVAGGSVQPLFACDKFTTAVLTVEGTMSDSVSNESFVSLLTVEGEGTLSYRGETYPLKKGQSVFLPAGMGTYELTGRMQVLRTRV